MITDKGFEKMQKLANANGMHIEYSDLLVGSKFAYTIDLYKGDNYVDFVWDNSRTTLRELRELIELYS